MKWYFASRMKNRDLVQNLTKKLVLLGETVVYDWSTQPTLRPYIENKKESSLIAENIGKALKDIDVFVLLSDKEGTDMFVELGLAIAVWQDKKNIRIYAVGEYNDRSLMHFHPSIIQVDDLEEVFEKESVKIEL